MPKLARTSGPPRRALILCNGEPPSRELTRRWARSCDYVIAADGGAEIARRCGIRLDVILGDLDSLPRATRRHFKSTPVLKIPRQDNSDLEKALDFAVKHQFEQALVLGAAGRRIDFTLANFASIWNYAGRLEVTLIGPGWLATPVIGARQIRAPRGGIVSLIPFGDCAGVTVRGLKYPLRGATLRLSARGVSNVVLRSPFSVRIQRGRLLLILFRRS